MLLFAIFGLLFYFWMVNSDEGKLWYYVMEGHKNLNPYPAETESD